MRACYAAVDTNFELTVLSWLDGAVHVARSHLVPDQLDRPDTQGVKRINLPGLDLSELRRVRAAGKRPPSDRPGQYVARQLHY